MRRNNFLIGALTALLTYVLLSTFVHRPWQHHRWHHHHEYYQDERHNNKKDEGSIEGKESRLNRLHTAMQQFIFQIAAR
jgi:hypothetical protein